MGGGDSQDANIEPNSDGALNIHVDALVIAYLQMGEISIGLTPKEQDQIVHKAKWCKWPWEGNSFIRVWENGRVWVGCEYIDRSQKPCRIMVKSLNFFTFFFFF
jgi:hypothetical protein